MARRRRSAIRGFQTNPPREITVVVAALLLIIGLLGTVIRVPGINVPNNLAVWALIVSSVLLILGSLVEGL